MTREIMWLRKLEKTLESPLDCKEIQPAHSEGDQPWDFFGRNDAKALATSYEELTYWKRLWCWEGLGASGEGDDRGWDGWMASLTRWTWVWVNSRSWWWTGSPGVLWFMELERVGHDWATELNWTENARKVMLKILQAMFQQYVYHELPDVQAGFRKGRGTRDQIANICWIIRKARAFQRNIYFCFIDYANAFDCVDHNKLENS